MSLRNLICSGAILTYCPFALRYANMAYALYHAGRDACSLFQQTALSELLNYAICHVPYYHDIVKIDEIQYFPILTKDIIRNRLGELYSDEWKKRHTYENTSGGSTGSPVRFLQDREYFNKNFGNTILFGLLQGKFPGDQELKLWGSERDILQGTIGLKEKCINWVFNRVLLNSFVLTPSKIENYILVINRIKPVQIWCYAESIHALSQYALEHKKNIFSPKSIVTTAGVLYDDMRNVIQTCFPESHICNQYGSREVGIIGVETEGKKGIRIFDHAVYLEVWDPITGKISNEGTGQLLVTCLTNKSMPLIRFNIGDVGTISNNISGQSGGFSLLQKMHGRINSHFKLQDGTLIHGEYFTHLFYRKNWIYQFQVIQHKYNDIEFKIVINSGYKENGDDLKQMKRDVCAVIPNAHVEVNIVDDISRLNSGKYQFVVSEV